MSTERRIKLFNLYAENFSIVTALPGLNTPFANSTGLYMCPLCFKTYGIAEIAPNGMLSLEHVVPQSLGGRKSDCVLTCKLCNNESGVLESKFVDSRRMQDVLEGRSSATVRMEYTLVKDGETLRLPANFRRNESHLEIVSLPKQTDPKVRAKVTDDSFGLGKEFTLHFTLEDMHRGDTKIALLKIAYLRLFQVLGYGALVGHNINAIREQILNPASQIVDYGILGGGAIPDERLGVALITEPSNIRSYQVVFDIVVEQVKTRVAVVLPNMGKPGLGIYDFYRSRPHDEDISAHFLLIQSDLRWLQDRELVHKMMRIWG